MKIDIKKMCSELGMSYKIINDVEYGFVGDVYILGATKYTVCYVSNAMITKYSAEKHIGFHNLCSNDNEECNYIKIKKILSKVIVKYKKLQIKLRKENMKDDFV